MRAIHTRGDIPRLINDPWAARLLTPADRDGIWGMVESRLDAVERASLGESTDRDEMLETALRLSPPYGGVILRTRYTEDCLEALARDGVRQYVIVGAGLDSFALRRPAYAEAVQVFEVDHPATQRLKRERLGQLGIASPDGVHFVAADLAREGLDAALARSPFEPAQRSLFAWLGVTPYLTREANLATLRAISTCAAIGSEVVFTYIDQRVLDAGPDDRDVEIARVRSAVAAAGEPWVSGFDPSRLDQDLVALGFALVEDLGGEALHDRYLGPGEGPYPRESGHIARACRSYWAAE
jgi:methyltransferase (TIGR00027 family)